MTAALGVGELDMGLVDMGLVDMGQHYEPSVYEFATTSATWRLLLRRSLQKNFCSARACACAHPCARLLAYGNQTSHLNQEGKEENGQAQADQKVGT